MKTLRGLLVLLVLPACTVPAQAQLFFKKSRPTPAQRVPELILTLKTETNERKRAQAAEELREYDPKTYTEIVPVLIDVLHNDKNSNVRMEALNSLSRIRPVSPAAGQAIEHAANSDDSVRVKLQAKSALLKYHLAGYSAPPKNQPSVYQPTSQEPPLAEPPAALPAATPAPAVPAAAFPPAAPAVAPAPVASQLPKATPAAPAPAATAPAGSAQDLPRPLPAGVALPPGQTPPPPMIQIEGPTLPPRPF
jgi:hypothetical protein